MKLLTQLIAIPSYSGNENAIQQFITEWLKAIKLKPILVAGNTVLLIPGTNQDSACIFNSHVDTVKPGTLALWENDPHEPWEKAGKLFGLGASDEKAGVAMCLLLAEHYAKQKPPCDLWFMFVGQEETTGLGSDDCLKWFANKKMKNYKKLAGILPEPTSLKTIEIGHKGNAFIKLTVTGESGHGSRPQEIKNNATLIMAKILLELPVLERKWKIFSDKILGSPSIASGTSISSGNIDTPNKIADTCIATLDIRTTPKLHDQILVQVKDYLKLYPVKTEFLFPPIPHGLTNDQSSIVRAAKKTFTTVPITTTEGSTDLCFFSKYNIDAIIMGPGEKECIHAPNEYCYPKKIKQSVESMKTLIQTWVGV